MALPTFHGQCTGLDATLGLEALLVYKTVTANATTSAARIAIKCRGGEGGGGGGVELRRERRVLERKKEGWKSNEKEHNKKASKANEKGNKKNQVKLKGDTPRGQRE